MHPIGRISNIGICCVNKAMKSRLSQCLESLQEVETKMVELEHKPTSELTGHQLVALSEALSFIRHAIAALLRTQHELADVPEKALRMNGH